MFRLALALLLGMACAAASGNEALQEAFAEAMYSLQVGRAAESEIILRNMLATTDSPRVKLELARALYAQAKYGEAKQLFQEVAARQDTPWRVRDNIALFVQDIEERTGYLKFGFTVVSDTNPRNLAPQKEFSVAGLRVTPDEAPQKMWGMRYSARGWLPVSAPLRVAVYGSASYVDFPSGDFDRLTIDGGIARALTASGRLRGKLGIEAGTFGGKLLYQMPYVGLDAVLAASESSRLVGEARLGHIKLPDFSYQDATFWSGALSLRHGVVPGLAATLRTGFEYSHAQERPYSYYGCEVTPGLNWLSFRTAYVVAANTTLASRRYEETDPLFGEQRSDTRRKLELSVGNKNWRWRQSHVSLLASVEDNRSSIEFYSYRKASFSVAVE